MYYQIDITISIVLQLVKSKPLNRFGLQNDFKKNARVFILNLYWLWGCFGDILVSRSTNVTLNVGLEKSIIQKKNIDCISFYLLFKL